MFNRRIPTNKCFVFARAPSVGGYWGFVRPYRAWLVGATLCGLLKFNLPLVFPWVLKHLIDGLNAATGISFAELTTLMVGVLLVYVVWAVATYFRSAWADYVSHRVSFDIRIALHRHLQGLPLAWHERYFAGALTSRLLADVASAQNLAGAAITNTLMDATSILLIAYLLFSENSYLTALALCSLPLYAYVVYYFQQKIRAVAKQAQQKNEDTSAIVTEQFSTLAFDRVYGRNTSNRQTFFRYSKDYLYMVLENVLNNARSLMVVGFITLSAPAIITWVAVLEVQAGRLSVGGLVVFYAYLGMLFQPLNRLSELNILLANALSANERVFELFNVATEKDDTDAPALSVTRGAITFEHVTFDYIDGRRALHDISFTLPPAKTIAFIGPSGAGKSTVFKVLTRLYPLQVGRIMVDGTDIAQVSAATLRAQIASVTQEATLVSGSIADNIRIGRPRATQTDIEAAAKAAHADMFIRALPEGYATQLGERGMQLSGGERQRIAIARAMLKNAPIVLLDEPTSALDAESEFHVREGLRNLTQARTTLIIAHRLHTVAHADVVIVLDAGRVVQMGTHTQLYAQEGVYRALVMRYFELENTQARV